MQAERGVPFEAAADRACEIKKTDAPFTRRYVLSRTPRLAPSVDLPRRPANQKNRAEFNRHDHGAGVIPDSVSGHLLESDP